MSESLSGPARCALLLYALGAEAASAILERLDPEQVGRILAASRRLRAEDADAMQRVLQEFQQVVQGNRMLPGESAAFLEHLLHKSGAAVPDVSEEEVGLCPEADAESLAQVLQNEHPQTVALVLAHVDVKRASETLQKLPLERRSEVVLRMAGLSAVPVPMLRQIEASLQSELKRRNRSQVRRLDGVETAAGLLKRLPKAQVSAMLEELTKRNAELAERVKRNLFTFEDLVGMDDRGVRNLLKEVDGQVLAKALKVADEALKERFFKNMSERAATMLSEDIESLPPMRLSEVEEAQKKVVEAAAALVQEGKALLLGAGDEQVV
ncbi:MAG: flagellar motor switch protein FliG [Myxococcales bacterium]|nr:flagellar motor switch protein FliG [Myxococcales bacterium]